MMIELKNVTKKFDSNDVVKNVNLKFETGNIYGFYGRNGSGKSVLMKLIAGLYVPTEGEVLYDGKNYNNVLEFPPSLRALIEKPNFFPDLTGYQNLELLAKIQNKIGKDEILKALEIVNLKDEKDKKYSKYSLGMKQKLGIAQAIMENPEIILLDEPFNGIEEVTVTKLIEYFKTIKKDKIIIFSTHIREDLDNLTDKVYICENGNLNEK